ncbi:hypothetical protein FOXB_12819 [Fusarium oxysporum f. sp. conglutinans Fo5176]|uniref:Uncharacterized protein n=1 Tax=Fusarium oxysporum (strain Fo5176) TaxID=660025 RepID=F9G2D7_FUSOF|nr:hypothetical protein FOXB_12819 [Fusarium oxysporum f. sp. conglutinans Fo5176]
MSDEQKPTNRKPLATFPRPTKKYRSEPYDRISLANSGFDGTGKTVFITGGATGVGYAIANAFAKAGARRIILVSRTVRSLENAKKSLSAQYPSLECLVFAASLTDYQKITDIVQQINDIDVLVHSAVMVNEPIPVEQIPVSTAQELFVTNVFGALNLFTAYCNYKTWVDWDDIELAGDYAVWLAGSNSAFLEGRFTWATWDMDELLALKAQIEQDPSYLTIGLKL